MNNLAALTAFLIAVLFTGSASQANANELSSQPGYVSGEMIYPLAHRPTPECHASTIAELPNGDFIAAWFGGRHEKSPDVGIWVARRSGNAWDRPREVADGVQYTTTTGEVKRHPCWNPVLFQPKHGPLMLFYKVGPSPSSWWGMLMMSEDQGKTWSVPRRLPEDIYGPVKNKPVQLPNGDILCGTSTEDQGWRVHFEITSDLGATWTRTPALNNGRKIAAIQPSILFHPDARLQALGRSRQGALWECWSGDQGRTWSELELTSLPNPSAGTDAVTLKDGRHVLVYNPTKRGRTPLTIAISGDGQEWKQVLTLENAPGEYSYPAVIQDSRGLLQITYTWRRQTVKHVVADPSKWK